MDILDAIRSRRSIREFTAETVDQATLQSLIDAAIQAPSAVNEQPWLFVVIRDKALLHRISREAKAQMLESEAVGSVSQHFQQLLNDPAFDIFYGAPVLVVIACRTKGPWAVEDCALAAENLMLAARAEGLGTCWIGFAQAWLRTPQGKTALALPSDCTPVAPIIVGHPKSAPPPVAHKEPQISWIGS